MYETMTLDSKTIIVKSDNAGELSKIIDFISKSDRQNNIKSFLKFASRSRRPVKNFKFNREDCYDK